MTIEKKTKTRCLFRLPNGLYHVQDGTRINGANSDMRGDCTSLRGDCTGLSGDCTLIPNSERPSNIADYVRSDEDKT